MPEGHASCSAHDKSLLKSDAVCSNKYCAADSTESDSCDKLDNNTNNMASNNGTMRTSHNDNALYPGLDCRLIGLKSSIAYRLPEIDISKLIKGDEHLKYFTDDIAKRVALFKEYLHRLNTQHGGIIEFSSSYKKYGSHFDEKTKTFLVLEYIPDVDQVFIYGAFNNFDKYANPMKRGQNGLWHFESKINEHDRSPPVAHLSELFLLIITKNKQILNRISPWSRCMIQDPGTLLFKPLFWNPDNQYEFVNAKVSIDTATTPLLIYEAHVGIASNEEKIASYSQFRTEMLPRIKKQGYNCLMLMAIQHHALYSSFGYQVTSFFSPASWFGSPDELKQLIDEAHSMNIAVILDVVYAHASNNTEDGLNLLNGTDHCYFHSGQKGTHPIWNSRIFDYENVETQRLLLSNISFWMDEFQVDGFRFDGIGSMIYHDLGLTTKFTGDYREYFNINSNHEALAFLMLANFLIKSKDEDSITIAEEFTGYPTLCRPICEGGVGFDYRFLMGIPDLWFKLLKSLSLDWNVCDIVSAFENRRKDEKAIAYSECHDQSLVGDKTIAMHLMDKEMYFSMSRSLPERNLVVDNGVAFLKLIKLLTVAAGGEGYLNFIGNEFGHPEWLDFPRKENDFSFKHAKRMFYLADSPDLYYHCLNLFDRALMHLAAECNWHSFANNFILVNPGDKVIALQRGAYIFIWNMSTDRSYKDYQIDFGTHPSILKCALHTDGLEHGGFGRIDGRIEVKTELNMHINSNHYSAKFYLPSKTGFIFKEELI
ncbi:MAG: 1,4-alpha-glucan branching enzyme [Marteilia pararefringens]